MPPFDKALRIEHTLSQFRSLPIPNKHETIE